MYDVLTFGNASFDALLGGSAFSAHKDMHSPTGVSQHLPAGAKVTVDWVWHGVGGGAVNTAITFARQGFRVGVVGRVGNDLFGSSILQHLAKEGVNTEHLHILPNSQSASSAILVAETGERTVLTFRGAFPNEKRQSFTETAAWFYITSLGGDLTKLRSLLTYAKKHRIKVALNPGVDELHQPAFCALVQDIDVLLVNHEEANYLLPKSERNQNRFVLLQSVTRAITVITNGARGAAVCDGRKVYYMQAQPVAAIDRLGAGDGFGSGFVAGLLRFEGNIIQAFQLATANAAAVCTQHGANSGILRVGDSYPFGQVTEHLL